MTGSGRGREGISRMLLHTLLRQFDPSISCTTLPNADVTGVRDDSRLVVPGDLFIARSGTQTDGSRYIRDAAERGAIAVVTESESPESPLPRVIVPSAALAGSVLANLLRDRPGESMRVFGVTGTNGKTTTAYLIRHLLATVKSRCGMIGTVEIDDGQACREASMTTPGAPEVADLLGRMRDNGCRACAMEVSSHALDQHRVSGVRFASVGFSNLTGDHLDYHKTMESYAAAKARLFEILDPSGVAVVNADDSWSDRMIRDCPGRVIRFGFGDQADYRAQDVSITSQGTRFILITPDGRTEVSMGLIGRHNIENALLAVAMVGETAGLSVHQLAAGLRKAQGAPGRLQAVRHGQPFAVLVDYAHTDDAMENVLSALRPLTRGKLRILFGCGGDRDRTKRPRMARTAARLADVVYVTSDNPRGEAPESILNDIRKGFPAARSDDVIVQIDRRRAIRQIIRDAEPGDVVLLAGKGHENYQIIGPEKHHFDDVEEAKNALLALGHSERRSTT